MAKLEFKSLEEAAAHAELQNEKIATLTVDLEELKSRCEQLESSSDDDAPSKEDKSEEIIFNVGKVKYSVKRTLKITQRGKAITASQIAQDEELAKKLIKAGVKSIKKV